MSSTEAGILELLERAARFHPLMLAAVSHKDHAVAFLQLMQKFIHLPCARQARLIHDVEMFLAAAIQIRSRQMMLEGARRDADAP